MNKLNLSTQSWAVNEYQLNYTPGQDTYQINVSDFGRPLNVVRATGNALLPFIPVPFDTINDLQYGTIWFDFWNTFGGIYPYPETLEHIAFYRSGANDQQFMCKIQPMPSQVQTYTISYVPGYFGTDLALNSSPALPEHQELLRYRAAIGLLPYTQWSDDKAADAMKKQELKDNFLYQLNRPDGKEELFRDYLRSITISRTVSVDDWNS